MSSTPFTAPPLPHQVNTTSQHNHKTTSVAGHRVKIAGLNLPAAQSVSLPANQKQEVLIIPSSSTPAFGSFFTIDIKNTGIILNNIILQFQYGTVVGSGLTGYFNPAWFHFTRIEVLQNGQTIDTIYGNQQFLLNQMIYYDEDRFSINQAAGQYSSTAQRTILSSQAATNTFYIPLRTHLNQAKIHLINPTDFVQLRVYMDTLANIFYVSAGTLTSCAFNAANVICDVTHLDQEEVNKRSMDIVQNSHHWIFHTSSYFTATIPSGVTSATLILASIVGNVAGLFFTLRASVVGTGAWNYYQLASYHLLDSASLSLVGGQPLPAALCANILNAQYCLSSYNIETSFGANDNKANFYVYSFSTDFVDALQHGRSLGSRKFFGNEQLVLNFPSAIGSNLQLDCYAIVENVLDQSSYSIKKVSM